MSEPEHPSETILNLPDAAATERLGGALGRALRAGDVVALSGGLGAGKSTLARAAIRARLGNSEAEVPSPTFTLVQTYEARDLEIWHVDLYRLDTATDAVELDLEDAFVNAASLIEWPERLGATLLPIDALYLALDVTGSARRARIAVTDIWQDRIEEILVDVG